MENYEQKYKEMKKRVLAIGQGYVKEVDYNSPRSIAEYIDPDLKESEDEKIREGIIKSIMDLNTDWLRLHHGVTKEEAIAWLEKQGNKVDVLDDFPTEFERQISHLIASSINKEWEYKKDFVKHTANALLQYAKNELEKQGEQKPTAHPLANEKMEIERWKEACKAACSDRNYRSHCGLTETRDDYFVDGVQWADENPKQNPAWSEDDELMIQDAIHWINEFQKSNRCKDENDMQNSVTCENWLKSLKDRVQPQPKQELSEDDENMRQDIISGLKAQIQSIYAYDEQGKAQMNNRIDWLKSIKINHWKPSEEQIGALNYAYCELFKRGENGEGINCVHPLMTLIDDLKKL